MAEENVETAPPADAPVAEPEAPAVEELLPGEVEMVKGQDLYSNKAFKAVKLRICKDFDLGLVGGSFFDMVFDHMAIAFLIINIDPKVITPLLHLSAPTSPSSPEAK